MKHIKPITTPPDSLVWGVVVTDPRTGETQVEFITEAGKLVALMKHHRWLHYMWASGMIGTAIGFTILAWVI